MTDQTGCPDHETRLECTCQHRTQASDERRERYHRAVWRSFEDGSDPVTNVMAMADAEHSALSEELLQMGRELSDAKRAYARLTRECDRAQQRLHLADGVHQENIRLHADCKQLLADNEAERAERKVVNQKLTKARAAIARVREVLENPYNLDANAVAEVRAALNAPTEPAEDRLAALAEELCHSYHYGVGLDELQDDDPDQAAAHREAAEHLLKWIEELPCEERRAAFQRGYDRGKERQKQRTAEDMARLEAEVAELRQDRDPDGLRARIRDLEHALRGWDTLMTGRNHSNPGTAPDWKATTAYYLAQLVEAQRELAALRGTQPSNIKEP